MSPNHEPSGTSSSFELLSTGMKKWVYKQGWTQLRPLQEKAIPKILTKSPHEEPHDIILTAATAGGKTEAAFLPIFSHLEISAPIQPGFRVLCISPLKALINDQYRRLKNMGEVSGIPVHRRHGDVSASEKAKAFKQPNGVFLTTPETLEALFVRKGGQLPGWFAGLEFIVIDELHVFIGSERGRQLQSLLNRIELAIRRRPKRIALSATLGDMAIAGNFLRPHRTKPADVIQDDGDGSDLRLQIKGYVEKAPDKNQKAISSGLEEEKPPTTTALIANHLFTHLRGRTNLAFANSRGRVELYANLLRQKCEKLRSPVEFHPHHGNLSKHLRETLETRLKSGAPTTAICTSTLELGIDIGSVHTVAQITPPFGVASLRQRLGRSGRQEGEAATLRMYITESELTKDSSLSQRLRLNLVQSVAIVELLLQRWYEPESGDALHLSTLVQQIISVIVQHGGARAKELFTSLCSQGPFKSVSQVTFMDTLRVLGAHAILQQSVDGTILLGPEGEKISGHYTFYAAFESDKEYTVVNQGRKLGSLPVSIILKPGMHIVFGGRNWYVDDVDLARLQINVAKSRGGTPIQFGGSAGQLHTGVVQMMRQVLTDEKVYSYLDTPATNLLSEARSTFQELSLANLTLFEGEGGVCVAPWIGDAALQALAFTLKGMDLDAEIHDNRFILVKGAGLTAVHTLLTSLAGCEPPEAVNLVPLDGTLDHAKYHYLLPKELLAQDYASSRMDVTGAWTYLRNL